jgi:hypothetical protein
VLALALAYSWQRMIDFGKVPGVEAIAAQHRMERTYISRILGLATLAPEIVEAALKGSEPSGLSMRKLMAGWLPVRWDQQRPSAEASRSTSPHSTRQGADAWTRWKSMNPCSTSARTSRTWSRLPTSTPSKPWTNFPSTGG